MSVCQICHNEFPNLHQGQLCPACAANVLANDSYSASDLRFVGVLSGFMTAAVASMPGAMIGFFIGKAFNNPTRGCTIGVIACSLIGLVVGFFIGPAIVNRMEAAKRQLAANQKV